MDAKIMEQVLTEILEDQKQIDNKLTSYTNILMDVHDRLGNQKTTDSSADLEKLSERLRAVQMACKTITEQISLPVKDITDLKQSLNSCTSQLKLPIKQKVVHHIAKVWIAAVVLLIGVLFLAYSLLQTNKKMQEYKANDLKYRQLNLTKNGTLRQFLMYADSLYLVNPDSFRVNVHRLEAQKRLQLGLLEQALEKEQEARSLRNQAGQVQPLK